MNTRVFLALGCLAATFLFLTCRRAEEPQVVTKAPPPPFELNPPRGLEEVPVPPDNPMTAEKVALGKQLYFDKRLSADGTVACADCHSPQFAFTDGNPVSAGIRGQKGGRSAPTVINRAYGKSQFWDGRAATLEQQALGPIQNPIEMGHTLEGMVRGIQGIEVYRAQLQKVFGSLTAENVAKAIAAYERTVLSGNAPIDRFNLGDENALSESAKRGVELFGGKARCGVCHTGPNFTDELFHNLGVGMNRKDPDLGRYAVTKEESDRGKFKTPTLREIVATAPYMHDGSQRTLQEVVDFYDKGGEKNAYLDKDIKPLGLTRRDKQDLIEFLKALSGEGWQTEPPKLP
ncbi:MAG: c-type cytochrome [Acidobacteria bacterium]|nr:c-type cytochrome [Acidobacteriota bacterium]